MFEWMPVLLIFLAGALTMRVWSEERRAGTLEFLLTTAGAPRCSWCWASSWPARAWWRVALAADPAAAVHRRAHWQPGLGAGDRRLSRAPVPGGAYVAIGLFVSARTDNQIVSLIVTVLLRGVLPARLATLLTGSGVARGWARVLSSIGTGAAVRVHHPRRAGPARPLLLPRCCGVFLTLNVCTGAASLGRQPSHRGHRVWSLRHAALVVANLLAANFWLAPIAGVARRPDGEP